MVYSYNCVVYWACMVLIVSHRPPSFTKRLHFCWWLREVKRKPWVQSSRCQQQQMLAVKVLHSSMPLMMKLEKWWSKKRWSNNLFNTQAYKQHVSVDILTYSCITIANLSCRKIPSLKQRIAGRSLPIEKFVINKAERYLQGEPLPLCGLVRIVWWSGLATTYYSKITVLMVQAITQGVWNNSQQTLVKWTCGVMFKHCHCDKWCSNPSVIIGPLYSWTY